MFPDKRRMGSGPTDYLQKLKAQYFDTKARYGSKLKAFYIVVCYSIVSRVRQTETLVTDKARKEKVKAIIREFLPETSVRVVEAEYAAWFLSLNGTSIDAIVKSRFGDQDIVFKDAMKLTSDLALMEKVLLLFLLWLHLFRNTTTVTADEIIHSPIIERLHQALALVHEERLYGFDYQIAHDLETLQNKFIECDSNGEYSLPIERVQPLVILMMDGSVRYEHQDYELLEYTLRLLGVFDLTESE